MNVANGSEEPVGSLGDAVDGQERERDHLPHGYYLRFAVDLRGAISATARITLL
jgi:hypothetical protein